jgi:hypothetical protein
VDAKMDVRKAAEALYELSWDSKQPQCGSKKRWIQSKQDYSDMIAWRKRHPEKCQNYDEKYYAINSHNILRSQILYKLNFGKVKKPKPDSIEKYMLIQHANGMWTTTENI